MPKAKTPPPTHTELQQQLFDMQHELTCAHAAMIYHEQAAKALEDTILKLNTKRFHLRVQLRMADPLQ